MQQFSTDVESAQDFIRYDYVPQQRYTIYYDRANEYAVLLSIAYNGLDMAFSMIFAFVMLVGMILFVDWACTRDSSEYSVCICCACSCPSLTALMSKTFPSAPSDNSTKIRAWLMWIWVSLILGLVVSLNLYYAPNISYNGRVAFLVVTMQCVTLGEVGLVYLSTITQTGKPIGMWLTWIILHYIPWGWLLPFKDQIAPNSTAYVVVMVVVSLLLFLICIKFITSVREERHYPAIKTEIELPPPPYPGQNPIDPPPPSPSTLY